MKAEEGKDEGGSGEKPENSKVRTKQSALPVIRLYTSLPKTTEAQLIGKQVLRSATSVGAQYREAQRAKSDADFISKVEGSLQELEETAYWLELLVEAGMVLEARLAPLMQETDELLAILVTIVTKVKKQNAPNLQTARGTSHAL